MGSSSGSNFQFSFWDSAVLSLTCKQHAVFIFQFSFWDSGRGPGGGDEAPAGILSILFLRFFPARPTRGRTTWALSILFLRFERVEERGQISVYEFFQFSFWDSTSTCCGRLCCWIRRIAGPRPCLSILFLRFRLHIRRPAGRIPGCSLFQFSFWDSLTLFFMFPGSEVWLSILFLRFKEGVWKTIEQAAQELFQFSFWDSIQEIHGVHQVRVDRFQFSFWDSKKRTTT